jgi:hypothetical protein
MEGGMTEFQRNQLQIICLFMATIAKSTHPNIETHPWPFSHDLDFDVLIYLSSPFDATDSSLEFIYGITTTLASFIHHITKLFKHTLYYTSLHLPLPSSLQDTCNILGERSTTWSLAQERLYSIDNTCNSQTPTLIQHHILAFYSAIRIFFHTRLSSCATSILAAYSHGTLSKLQQMENIKMQHISNTTEKVMAPVVCRGLWLLVKQLVLTVMRGRGGGSGFRAIALGVSRLCGLWCRMFGRRGGAVMGMWHCGSMFVGEKDRGSLVVVN